MKKETSSDLAPATDAPVPDNPEQVRPDQQTSSGYAPQSGGRPLPAEPEAQTDKLEANVGGGLILFYYQPTQKGTKNYFEIFEARLRMDARYGRFLMHITPRFRNTLERDFFVSTGWVEEAYMAAEFGPTILKVGKVYRQFGRFWDNSFMGNVQEYDGLKLDMNHGISYEGLLREKERWGVGFAAQYFIVDGTTNYALPGRDTLTLPNSRRRNQLVGRVEPFYKVNDLITVKLGLSEEYFQADLASIGKQNVTRTAVDTTLMVGPVTAWAEYTRQFGRHTTDFPIPPVPATDDEDEIPGQSSNRIHYVLVGGEYTYKMLTVRYNFSMGNYQQVGVKERRNVPGLQVAINPYMMALLELSHVQFHRSSGNQLLDRAIVLTLHGKF